MEKKEIQKRVLKNGKPLDLDKFKWDKKTKVFFTEEYGLELFFSDIENTIFIVGGNSTLHCGHNCIFITNSLSKFFYKRNCTVIRKDMNEVVQSNSYGYCQIMPFGIKGFLINGIHNIDKKRYIIIDGKAFEVLISRYNLYKVREYYSTEEIYLIEEKENNFIFCKDFEEAKKFYKGKR